VIHVVVEALIIGAILIFVRNVLALPIACVLWAFGVEESQQKARAFVGRLGTLMLIAFMLLTFAAVWKSGLPSALGAALCEIVANVVRAVWYLLVSAWRYVLS
jgi:hypothetical protein